MNASPDDDSDFLDKVPPELRAAAARDALDSKMLYAHLAANDTEHVQAILADVSARGRSDYVLLCCIGIGIHLGQVIEGAGLWRDEALGGVTFQGVMDRAVMTAVATNERFNK